MSARAAVKEIIDFEGLRTVNEHVVQNWFRCFKNGDSSLEDKSSSGRPSAVEDEPLFDITEQQSSTNTSTLFAEFCP